MNEPRYSFFSFMRDASPGRLLIFLIFLALTGLSIASFISLTLGAMIWGFEPGQLNEITQYPSTQKEISFLKFSQFASSIGVFILPSILIRKLSGETFLHEIKPQFSRYAMLILLCGLVMILQNPLINLLAEWNAAITLPEFLSGLQNWMENSEKQAELLTEKFLEMSSFSDLLITLLLIAVIPAVGEELLFRGALQPLIQKIVTNEHAAVWLTAFIFSFIHFQFFGFIPRFLLGAFLGYLYVWGRSLVFPVVAHFSNNGLAVVLSFMHQKGFIDDSFVEPGTGDNGLIYAAVSIVILLAFCSFFKKQTQEILSKELYKP